MAFSRRSGEPPRPPSHPLPKPFFPLSYDALAAVALVRAAERSRSPAILMIFPVTMHWGGKSFLRYLVDLAHSASVPIAVHLDHATTDEDIDTALTWAEQGVAFDSIMVDASHAETDEENLEIVGV